MRILNPSKRYLIILLLLFFAIVIGLVQWSSSSEAPSKRKIAGAEIESWLDENSPYDLTNFSGAELAIRAKIRLAQKAEFQKDLEVSSDKGGTLSLSLPNFLVSDQGQAKSICQVLPWIEIVLQAEGVLENGEPVEIPVRSACVVSENDSEKLQPLIITSPKLKNYRQWSVSSIHLYSTDRPGDLLKINSLEIRKVINRDLLTE